MTIKEIVTEVRAKYPEINNVYFVGCGASQSDLYTACLLYTSDAADEL